MSDEELRQWARTILESQPFKSQEYGLALGITRLLAEKDDLQKLYGWDSHGNLIEIPRKSQ